MPFECEVAPLFDLGQSHFFTHIGGHCDEIQSKTEVKVTDARGNGRRRVYADNVFVSVGLFFASG